VVDAQTETNRTRESTSWRDEPNGRGTFSLILSCIVTLTLCVWSALHLNVPAQRTFRRRFLDKTKWVLYGIFAPELVVATAAAQFIVARWLKREIEKDARYRRDEKAQNASSHTWNLTQCFYAVSGGFTTDRPWTDEYDVHLDAEAGAGRRVTITPEGIRLLSFLGRLPRIEESDIRDKSKADWMAKSIICLQAGWMVVQVLGRAIKGMPISMLEINTCGHVACALVMYLLWWSKPLDVEVPTVLNDEENRDICSLMYLCTSVSADATGITDIRCFIHVANERDEGLWRPNFELEEDGDGPVAPAASVQQEDVQGINGQTTDEVTTYISIGSPGSRDPRGFLGFPDLRANESKADPKENGSPPSGSQRPGARNLQRTASANSNLALRYNFNLTAPPIAPRCRATYFSPPYYSASEPNPMSLRHSHYCRRVFPDARPQASGASKRPIPQPLLASASRATNILRGECEAGSRPEYKPYYFTFVPQLGTFLGETDYLVEGPMENFPSLHNLGLGQVNIHRDTLRSVLALTAAAYGALHCPSGWTDLEIFPTGVERMLWIASALTICCSGAVLWAFFSTRQFWPAFDRWVSGATPGVHITSVQVQSRWVIWAKRWTMYLLLLLFGVARVFLVVEAFVGLRDAPVELYETPEWTDFLPHF